MLSGWGWVAPLWRQNVDRQESFSPRKLVVPVLIAVPFWVLGVVAWQASGYIEALLNFAYIGTSVAVGLGLYAALPRRRKPWGRRLTLFLVGGYMLGLVGILGRENVQIEGVFFALLIGATGAALMHYLVAKVFGPLLFGRMWCGWACWTAAVLDLLPYRQPPGPARPALGVAALRPLRRQRRARVRPLVCAAATAMAARRRR